MKKLIPYVLTGIFALSCASNIKLNRKDIKLNGNFKDLGEVISPTMGRLRQLEFHSEKDSSLYIIPYDGSDLDLEFLKLLTKDKILDYNPFYGTPPNDFDEMKGILGLSKP